MKGFFRDHEFLLSVGFVHVGLKVAYLSSVLVGRGSIEPFVYVHEFSGGNGTTLWLEHTTVLHKYRTSVASP